MNVGFPSVRFSADNSGKFANVKLDEFTSKLGLTAKFGPAYSPWINGISKSNHASADITIKKLMEEQKTPLIDSLAWTHNTSVNKLSFSPFQLVPGKAFIIPGLINENMASDSM